jgi:hypothetical protein
MPILTTNGLTPHPDFPVQPYEAVHAAVVRNWQNTEFYVHFSGAWNALAYRFQGAIEAGEQFQRSLIAHGAHPVPAERYEQERALFDFFSNGFSAFEAAFYGMFAIGAMIAPASFPLNAPRDQQRVSPNYTAEACKRAFPDDPLLRVFELVFADQAYQQWREVRNVLTHRTAPGRRIFVSIGQDDAPPVEWKLNDLPLDEALVVNRQAELARLICDILSGIEIFTSERT